jgi:hypothetical protein
VRDGGGPHEPGYIEVKFEMFAHDLTQPGDAEPEQDAIAGAVREVIEAAGGTVTHGPEVTVQLRRRPVTWLHVRVEVNATGVTPAGLGYLLAATQMGGGRNE